VKRSIQVATGNKVWTGEESSPVSCDTSGHGGEDKTKTPRQEEVTSGTLWLELPSLPHMKPDPLVRTVDSRHYQINQWVFVNFRDTQSNHTYQDFGTILQRFDDYYVVQLEHGGFATVPIECIREAGRA
jgi:hypothetical protein